MNRRRDVTVILAIVLAAIAAAPAQAAQEAKGSEARAIKKAFMAGREEPTQIKKILVSTDDPRFASVSFTVTIEQARSAAQTYKAPVPTILQERKGKWKPKPKPPKKLPKDIKPKNVKTSVQISGEYNALLTRDASCGGEAGVSLYDPGSDTLLDVQFHGDTWRGPGLYRAYSVGSVAGIYLDSGQVLMYETGQPDDAFTDSGVIYIDLGWGFIDAFMSPADPGTGGNNVLAKGDWACR